MCTFSFTASATYRNRCDPSFEKSMSHNEPAPSVFWATNASFTNVPSFLNRNHACGSWFTPFRRHVLHLGLAYVVFFGTNARKRRGVSTRIFWVVVSSTP